MAVWISSDFAGAPGSDAGFVAAAVGERLPSGLHKLLELFCSSLAAFFFVVLFYGPGDHAGNAACHVYCGRRNSRGAATDGIPSGNFDSKGL